MLLCSHHLTLATLDYLMVAQCASLTHRIVIVGWDLMQLPWVKVYAGSGETYYRNPPRLMVFLSPRVCLRLLLPAAL